MKLAANKYIAILDTIPLNALYVYSLDGILLSLYQV